MVTLLLNALHGQEWNYARLSLIYGGNIPFNFNSIEKYVNGIEMENATILGITLADSGQAGHTLEGFDLNIRTFNGAAVLKGDVHSLDLNRIRVKAENYIGLASGFSYGYQDLSAAWNTLFSYSETPFFNLSWDNHQVAVSYECGKPLSAGGNGSLLGEPPDHYAVEIELELVPSGPGF
jgi:hypothetical protein